MIGDPLLETIASFIVTGALKERIKASRATGVRLGEMEISKSGEFEDFFPNRELPRFAWLQVAGNVGKDHLGLSPTHWLVISEGIFELLRAQGMSHLK